MVMNGAQNHRQLKRVDATYQNAYGLRGLDDLIARRVDGRTAGGVSPDGSYATGVSDGSYRVLSDVQLSVREVMSATAGVAVERRRYTAYGERQDQLIADFNGDGFVDFFDYDAHADAFEDGVPAPDDMKADVNGDGIVDFFDLDAFAVMFDPGAAGALPAVRHGYCGYVEDRATGLWLARFRWYDADQGRWLQRDPAGYVDGMGLYGYIDSPLMFEDPYGLEPEQTVPQWHHMIPKPIRDALGKSGACIDPHGAKYGRVFLPGDHWFPGDNGVHKDYNDAWIEWWKDFKNKNKRTPGANDIDNFIKQLEDDKRFSSWLSKAAKATCSYRQWSDKKMTFVRKWLLASKLFQREVLQASIAKVRNILLARAAKKAGKSTIKQVPVAGHLWTLAAATFAYCTSSGKSYGQCVAEEIVSFTEEEIKEFADQAEACGRLMMRDSKVADVINDICETGCQDVTRPKFSPAEQSVPADDRTRNPDTEDPNIP
jgi:RHS repeat-associated protein